MVEIAAIVKIIIVVFMSAGKQKEQTKQKEIFAGTFGATGTSKCTGE